MVTRFDCLTVRNMRRISRMHWPMSRLVKDEVEGFIGVKLLKDWPNRTVYSISLWQDRQSIYGMGEVSAHVRASRVPARLGVTTSCGVFDYAGDWRNVLFGKGWGGPSPLCPGVHRSPVTD